MVDILGDSTEGSSSTGECRPSREVAELMMRVCPGGLLCLHLQRSREWLQQFSASLHSSISLSTPVWLSAMMFRRVGGHALRCCGQRPVAGRKLAGRKFSAYSTSTTAAPATTSPLGSVAVELDRIAPRFEVPASQITILESPASFFSTLKVCDAEPATV